MRMIEWIDPLSLWERAGVRAERSEETLQDQRKQ